MGLGCQVLSPLWYRLIVSTYLVVPYHWHLLRDAHVCTFEQNGGDVDTTSYPLRWHRLIAAILVVLSPRQGHSEVIFVADP